MARDQLTFLLISGSLRAGSTNSAAIRTMAELAPQGVIAQIYGGLANLPHFNPDDDLEGAPLHPAVVALRSAINDADALLFCTPEYAGALPGSFKNLLEWTVGDAGTHDKPVAWVNAAQIHAPTGGADAHDSLRKVLGYVGAEIVEGACTRVPVARNVVDDRGLVTDHDVRSALSAVLETLASFVRARREDGRDQRTSAAAS